MELVLELALLLLRAMRSLGFEPHAQRGGLALALAALDLLALATFCFEARVLFGLAPCALGREAPRIFLGLAPSLLFDLSLGLCLFGLNSLFLERHQLLQVEKYRRLFSLTHLGCLSTSLTRRPTGARGRDIGGARIV
jgi:hypothetical protein